MKSACLFPKSGSSKSMRPPPKSNPRMLLKVGHSSFSHSASVISSSITGCSIISSSVELSVISGSPGGSPLSDSTSPSSLWTSSQFSPRTEEIITRASSNSSAMNSGSGNPLSDSLISMGPNTTPPKSVSSQVPPCHSFFISLC